MENSLEAKKETFKEQKERNAEYDEYSEAKRKMEKLEAKSVHDLGLSFHADQEKCNNKNSRDISGLEDTKCVHFDPRWVIL